MFKPIHLLAALGLALAPIQALASHPNTITENWTIHQAFENQPRKIIDTKDRVFFLVHQHIYSPDIKAYDTDLKTGYYSTPSGAVFIYDKNDPEAGLKSLAQLANISGFDVRLVNYNPQNGTLVIGYTDGGLDIISADYKVTYIDAVKNRVIPGAHVISAINFDPQTNDIWIGTGAGFVHIGADNKVRHIANWNEPVTDIIPVGDNVAAALGTSIYMAQKSSNLNLRDNFVKATGLGSYGTITNLMPLAHSTFASINTNGQIYFFSPNGAAWKATSAGGDANIQQKNTNINGNTSNQYVINMIDHTVTPTDNGFYVAATNYAYFINNPEQAGAVPTLKKIALPASSPVYNASYDGETFWFYSDPRKFVSKKYENSAWSEAVLTLEPNGPNGTKDNIFQYSPEHGMVVVAKHPHRKTHYYNSYRSALLAAYKDGVWRDLTPSHIVPYIATPGSGAESDRLSRIGAFAWPMPLPLGAMVDPLNPNMIFITSSYHSAIAGLYIDDPKKIPFIITFPGQLGDNWMKSYSPNPALEPSPAWNGFGPGIPLGTDKNGNIWFWWNSSFTANNDENFIFHYISPDGRKDAIETADPGVKHFDVKKLVVKSILDANFWMYGTLLTSNGNDTKIVATTKDGDRIGTAIYIIDHKGTLEDTSDDTVTYIRKLRTESGYIALPSNPNIVKENPVTGDIVYSCQSNTYLINPNSPVVDETVDVRVISIEGENGKPVAYRGAIPANDIIFDEYGRMWMATADNGVIGFSADGKSVIAHYTPENSPIGSTDVYGLGWNPDTKSLFISAHNVLAEVKVDLPETVASAEGGSASMQPYAVPAAVGNDFGGTIAIHNVPVNVSLRVRNSEGKTVCMLDTPVDGITFWNLLDSEGNMVPTDNYTIMDASGNDHVSPLTIPVIR